MRYLDPKNVQSAAPNPWEKAPSDPSSSGTPGTSRLGWLQRSWVTSKPGAGCGLQTMG